MRLGRLALGAGIVVGLLAGALVLLDPERRELDAAERERLGGTYVELAEGVTHYRLQGPSDGPFVVLVHGGSIPIWTWDDLSAALVGAGFRVLTYDAFGRGYSDRPKVVYDRDLYDRQLTQLLDTLGVGGASHVVGLSQGGGTAIEFTARHPERVGRLVLIAPVVRDLDVAGAFGVPGLGELLARTVGVRVLVRRAVENFGDHPERERYTRLMREQTTYRGFRRSILSMLRHDALGDFTAAYRTVGGQDRAVMLVWGDADEEITAPMIATAREALPGLDFRSVEGVGHGIVFQRSEVVRHLVVEFLGTDASAGEASAPTGSPLPGSQ